MKRMSRFNLSTRMWEYGYYMGSVFVVLAKYPAVEQSA
jgi:hypothetical protein